MGSCRVVKWRAQDRPCRSAPYADYIAYVEYPLVTFSDGPTGPRAKLIDGPDVWEVAMWVEGLADEADPVATLLRESDLSRAQVDAALHYRAAYPEEIAARIKLHRQQTAAAQKR